MPSREFVERVLSTGQADDVEEEVIDDAAGEVQADEEGGSEGDEAEVVAEEADDSEEPEEEELEPADAPEGDEEEESLPAEEDQEPEEAEEPSAEQGDEFYLGRYKTREEAEKGWRENEKFISQQGEQIHQMEQRMAQYEGYLAALNARTDSSEPGEFEEWANGFFEAGQPHAGWQEVVEAYQQTGDEDYLDAYVEVWKEHDPYEASRMRNLLDTAAAINRQQRLDSMPAPPSVQDVVNESWVEVAQTDPDLRDEEFAKGVGQILKNVPALRAAALSGDPDQVKSAISVARDGYRMQSARTGNGTPRKVKKGDAERLQQDKLAATVTTGDSAPERGRASTPEVPPELQEMMQRIQQGEGGFPKLRE
jgi:hypothetical protein